MGDFSKAFCGVAETPYGFEGWGTSRPGNTRALAWNHYSPKPEPTAAELAAAVVEDFDVACNDGVEAEVMDDLWVVWDIDHHNWDMAERAAMSLCGWEAAKQEAAEAAFQGWIRDGVAAAIALMDEEAAPVWSTFRKLGTDAKILPRERVVVTEMMDDLRQSRATTPAPTPSWWADFHDDYAQDSKWG